MILRRSKQRGGALRPLPYEQRYGKRQGLTAQSQEL